MDLESELATAVQNDRIIVVPVASLAFAVYDYTLTLRAEVQLVWRAKWTPGTALFLIVRYLPFVYFPLLLIQMLVQAPSEALCTRFLYGSQYMIIIQGALSETVIALRTWALWDRRRGVAVLLVLLWCEAIIVCTFYTHSALSVEESDSLQLPTIPHRRYLRDASDSPGFGLAGCIWIADGTGAQLTNSYIAWTVSETLYLYLTLIRGAIHWRNKSFANLLTVLYRDAFLVSFVYSGIAITALVLLHTGQPVWANAFTMFYAASKAVLPGRIILNLREAAMSLDNWDIPTMAPSPSMISLHSPPRRTSTDTDRV
ncbi:hypothetical protein CALCODRAFT_287248 [Calocera cornea HHB12733]|uniref:DUF6533 domain-containing protein n=1 Tax=Calocera cornea HHB12733 TaxID=1353952 RepID=A0A165FXQ2_9BASI|nr:hypothetical protein CALCODRAFT_287248 [Calocera cornea HHB12733]